MELCQPKKCGLECIKYCPVNKSGADCIVLNEETKKARIDEDICNGCGICVKVCPFDAITIVNLASELATDKIHQYGPNSFRLYKLPTPKKGRRLWNTTLLSSTNSKTNLKRSSNKLWRLLHPSTEHYPHNLQLRCKTVIWEWMVVEAAGLLCN